MTTTTTRTEKLPLPVVCGEGAVGASDVTVRYTIATLVNDRAQYDAMVRSFQSGGFSGPDCEYIFIDNTGGAQTCAYSGLNRALSQARGRYVVLCHQDVRLIDDGRAALDDRISELDAHDPAWAVVGNAGGVRPGVLALRISDPHGSNQFQGPFPARVKSVDENFIVVKAQSRVGFSNDLSGFHLYGADLCLNADVRGYTSYVTDFHLQHLSAGSKSAAFAQSERAFRSKWNRALGSRIIQTTCTLVWVGGDRLGSPVRVMGEKLIPPSIRLCARASEFAHISLERLASVTRRLKVWMRLRVGRDA